MLRITFYLLTISCLSILLSCTPKAAAENTELTTIDTRVNDEPVHPPFQIFLVRHAEKSKDDPRDPNLNEAGKERAEKLKYHLAEANITKIYSTDYKRTRQTVQPLASALGIEIEIYNPRTEDITQLLSNAKEGNILVAGHSNTTPSLCNKLLGKEVYAQLDESVYNKLFVLIKSSNSFETTLLQY